MEEERFTNTIQRYSIPRRTVIVRRGERWWLHEAMARVAVARAPERWPADTVAHQQPQQEDLRQHAFRGW